MTKEYKPLAEICLDIYRELYQKAEPSADFDVLVETGVTAKPDWFDNYYLSREEQQEILDRHCDKYDLTDREYFRIEMNIFFGGSPTMHKEDK
ncbi:hypothetical protein ACFL0V_04320 [Nanoarchaeota archaeon]